MSEANETTGVEVHTLLHKRVLAVIKTGNFLNYSNVEEYKVLEISPSGKWIKLQNINGRKFWKAIADVTYIESLKTLVKATVESELKATKGAVVITEEELLSALKDPTSEMEVGL